MGHFMGTKFWVKVNFAQCLLPLIPDSPPWAQKPAWLQYIRLEQEVPSHKKLLQIVVFEEGLNSKNQGHHGNLRRWELTYRGIMHPQFMATFELHNW